MNKWIAYSLTLVLLIASFTACKSKKQLAAPKPMSKDTAVIVKTDTKAAEKLLSNTLTNWQYFSAKADVDFDNGSTSMGVDANIRMLKDSLVWINVSKLGFQAARILINKDSLVVMFILEKKYDVYYAKDIEKLLGVELSVGQIQNLLLAKPLFALQLFDLVKNTDTEIEIKDNSHDKFTLNHYYQKQFLIINKTRLDDRTAPHYAQVLYNSFSSVGNHNFPYKLAMETYNGKSKTSISISFEKPDFETVATFPFSIPPSYERK